ncbi:MAG: LytTR family DNA-binding domain-containing protein [Bacteroidota bacterium]
MESIYPIRCILIDDEWSALMTLQGMIQQFCPNLEIVGLARSVQEAVGLITKFKPDLIFLDIEITPQQTGFSILEQLPQSSFKIIMTTAYEQYAKESINRIQPSGYLVKPIDVEELAKVVDNTINQIQRSNNTSTATSHKLGLLIIDRRKGNTVVKFEDLFYCKADQHTTDVFFQQNGQIKKINSASTLTKFCAELKPDQFFRVHHSYIVNLEQILSYQKTGRNGVIHLAYDIKVPISVKKMEAFEAHFKNYLQGKK